MQTNIKSDLKIQKKTEVPISVGAVKSCTGWRIQRKRNQMMMI